MHHRPSLQQLDHVVIAHSDLDSAREEFADLTGCMPAYGGPHPGGGTHNALVSLGESVYIELISPDPKQATGETTAASNPLRRRLASYPDMQLLAWAIRSDNLANVRSSIETTRPFAMSRQQPDGTRLQWQLMRLVQHDLGGFAPFYIDWQECPHPSNSNPIAGQFESLQITHPSAALGEQLQHTGNVAFHTGPEEFVLNFSAARGSIALRATQLAGFWL